MRKKITQTLYVRHDEKHIWDEAKKFLRFHTEENLSSYVTKCLKKLLKDGAKYKAKI